MMLKQTGYTLTELLVTGMIAALLAAAALPPLNNFYERTQARQDIAHLQMLISRSREQALHLRNRVTLCPLNDNRCSRDWNNPISLFTDTNNNRQLDPDEQQLSTFNAVRSTQVLRHFNNNAISFDSNGFAGHAAGSFSYCLRGTRSHGIAIIISRNGRIRQGTDSNGDGLPETANGENIPCPG